MWPAKPKIQAVLASHSIALTETLQSKMPTLTIQPFTESWPAHSLGQSTANRVYTDCGVKRWALCERQGFTQCMEGVVEN